MHNSRLRRRPPIGICGPFVSGFIALVGLTAVSIVTRADDDATLSIDEVIATIREFESKVDCVQFDCAVRLGSAIQGEEGWQIDKPSENCSDCSVIWRPATDQFVVRTDSIDSAITEGATESERNTFAGTHSEYSSDGQEYRSWYRLQLGKEIATSDALATQVERTGLICQPEDELHRQQGYKLNDHQTGIGWVVPYVKPFGEHRQKLSDLLTAKKEDRIRARVTEDGNWKIHFVSEKTSTSPYEMCLDYDPRVGRLIRCEAVRSGSVEYRWGDWKVFHVVEFVYDNASALIPSLVNSVENLHSLPDARIYQWTYSNQRLNPDVPDSEFRIAFEKGVEVTDYLHKKAYVAGSGLDDDQQALAKFVQLHGLEPSNPAGPPPIAESRRQWVWIANGVILAVLIVMLMARRLRRKARTVGMILIGLAACPGNLRAEQASPRSPERDSSEIRTQQCGHLVTMLALQLRSVKYDLNLLRHEMKPTDEGVSLAQIKRMLDACGLETEAKKNLSIAQIGDASRNGYLAIVPVVIKNGRGHYLMVSHSSQAKEPVVINPLISVRPISVGLTDMQLTHGGMVLFVGGQRATGKGTRPALRFDPGEIRLGNVKVDGPGSVSPLEHHFSLRNDSDRPVLVTEIAGSCGCTEPNWRTGIVDPRGSREIVLTISKLRWGVGPQDRRLTARLTDGTSVEMQITGTGVSASRQAELQVAPASLSYEIDSPFLADGPVELPEKSLLVSFAARLLPELQVKANVPWISTAISEIDDSHRDLNIRVTVDDGLRGQLRDLLHTERGEVAISAGADMTPVSAQISIRRAPIFAFSSKSVVLKKAEREIELRVVPTKEDGPQQFEFGELGSIPRGLEFSVVTDADAPGRLKISRAPDLAPRSYLVRAEVKCDRGRDIIHSTVVVE